MKRKADSAYRKAALVVAVAGVAFASIAADTVPANERIEWLSSVTEGYYNDPANWTGGVMPTNGIDGKYGLINFQANDMTIKAPAGGLVENSGTMFLGCGSGTHTLTVALFGILRPGDVMLSLSGVPYDTILPVIGIDGEGRPL